MQKIEAQIKKLTTNAIIPTKSEPGAAGYDVYSTEYVEIKPFEYKMVKTGISVAIPEGYYIRVAPRSGLAVKQGATIMAGVVDPSYRGEIMVVMQNSNVLGWLSYILTSIAKSLKLSMVENSAGTIKINPGDRIAQFIFEKYHDVDFKEVDKLPDSVRKDGGFGSSGV